MSRGARIGLAALCLAAAAAARDGAAQSLPPPDATGGKEVAPAVEQPAGPLKRALRAVGHEAGRYASDSIAFVLAPGSWTKAEWRKAGGVALVLGGLFAADRSIMRAAQRNRSDFTDHVSSATTSFGGGNGTQVAILAIGGGLAFGSKDVRDTGREALEASILTAFVENYGIKRLFGRERPYRSDGKTDFDFGSSNSSFPSGHATQAFALASVIAARTKGWVVPTIAYTLASVVAFDRVNDNVHFASDVFAGAAFGTVVGRYIVHKHEREAVGETTKTSFDVVPIRNGLAMRVTF